MLKRLTRLKQYNNEKKLQSIKDKMTDHSDKNIFMKIENLIKRILNE